MQPFDAEKRAAGRAGTALIKGGKPPRIEALLGKEKRAPEPPRPQGIAFVAAQGIDILAERQSGKIDDLPLFRFLGIVMRVRRISETPDEIVLVPAGLNKQNAPGFVHQAGRDHLREPRPQRVPNGRTVGFLTILERIIDDKKIAAAPGGRAAATDERENAAFVGFEAVRCLAVVFEYDFG